MAIPIFAAQAQGGKILSLDDQAVVKDLANLDGTGGTAYTCFMRTTPFQSSGYAHLRRLIQSIPHDGAVTVTVTPWRDDLETGQTITRTLAGGDTTELTFPLSVTGSQFHVKLSLSGFDAAASVGRGELTVMPRRSQR